MVGLQLPYLVCCHFILLELLNLLLPVFSVPCMLQKEGNCHTPFCIITLTTTLPVSKATLGKLLRDGVERIYMGFFKCGDTILR